MSYFFDIPLLNITFVYQRLAVDRRFSPGALVRSTNKIDRNDIAEILLKVALNTTTQYYFQHNQCKQWFISILLLNIR